MSFPKERQKLFSFYTPLKGGVVKSKKDFAIALRRVEQGEGNMSKGRTTDALDRWTISIDANPRLAAALAARPDETTDADETTDGDSVRALLALLGALPHPDRGIIVDWLFAGRRITRRLLTDHRISSRTAKRVIAESGIEGLLLAIQRPADTARHIGRADASGTLYALSMRSHGNTRDKGRASPPLGSVTPYPSRPKRANPKNFTD